MTFGEPRWTFGLLLPRTMTTIEPEPVVAQLLRAAPPTVALGQVARARELLHGPAVASARQLCARPLVGGLTCARQRERKRRPEHEAPTAPGRPQGHEL